MTNFLKRAQELDNVIKKHRHYLHENAEVGLDLPVTTKYVIDALKKIGLEPKEISQSGVTAVIEGKSPGKTILLRADTDALPMTENNELPFKSKTIHAHNCGHDIHASMLLGAAQILKENQGTLEGTVKLMFQPAEEIFAGSDKMIAAGLLENPDVNAAFAMHTAMEGPVGSIFYTKGYSTSSCNGFKITIKGRGCHGAMPDLGIDPINVGVHIYLAMQEIIAREAPPYETVILTVGQFLAGTAGNIIPETAVLQGTMRTYNKEVRTKLVKRLREIVAGVAETFGATAEYEVLSDVPSNYNNPELTDEMIGYIDSLDYTFEKTYGYRVTPSDDFARISERVPTTYINLGCKPGDNPWPLHNPGVLFDEAILSLGAAIHAQCAYNWLKNNK